MPASRKRPLDWALPALDEYEAGLAQGTRDYGVSRTRYTLIYEHTADGVLILHCWHQSKDAPE